jgi:signal transduction histidine kinase
MMKSVWNFLTRPRVTNPDEARREYLTRVVLTMMMLVALGIAVPVFAGYSSGDFGLDAPIIMLGIGLVIAAGWGLVQIGQWRWGAAIPPILFMLYGWYITYQYGPVASSGLSYAMAIVLAALLHNAWMPWVVFGLFVILDISTVRLVYNPTWADVGPIMIPRGGILLGLTILQSFSSLLLENALKQAHQATHEAEQANARLHQEAEERQKLIGELQAKNKELEQFTYTVSHDLKSPLVTIRGFLGFLEKDAEAGNIPQMRKDIERITTAADKMQRLLEELLELSRIGRITNPMQEMPFNTIVHEALEMVQGAVEARKVRVVVAENLPNVRVDRVRLVQVMQNLLDNAVKFMGNQTQPRIDVGVVTQPRDGFPQVQLQDMVFFVRDNGIGIAPEHHERIFGLFNKLDARSEGTGIGLALVKRIIQVHGGIVWVESAGNGSGSTFYFTLPKTQ